MDCMSDGISQSQENNGPVPPGKGFFGWLGRQVGYVSRAVAFDPAERNTGPRTVYRNQTVEEQPLPDDPAVRLRRTTIDEVILDENPKSEVRNPKM